MYGSRIAYALLMIAAAVIATCLVRREQVSLPLSGCQSTSSPTAYFVLEASLSDPKNFCLLA